MAHQESISKKERLRSLLCTSDFSDCCFIVEGTEIKAHKLILTCSSPVFEKMFYGDMASDRVLISDICFEDFQQMLEFVYTDNVVISSVLNAWSLFYVAHKYLLSDFSHVCTAYIEKNLSISTLVLSYEFAEMYGLSELQRKCLNDICDYIQGIFNQDCDYHMKTTTLTAILKQTTLNINNENLVKGVFQWALNEANLKKQEVTPQSLIGILSTQAILPFIVPLKLESLPSPSVLFSKTWELFLPLKRQDALSYQKKHWSTICKTRQIYKIAKRVKLQDEDTFLSQISVNRSIVLYGLVVLTENEGCGNYNGEIVVEIEENKSVFLRTCFKGLLAYETLCYIPLADLIKLECDKTYSVKVIYKNYDTTDSDLNTRKGSILCYFVSSKLVDEKRKIVVSFDEVNGSVIKGICYYPA